GTAGSAGPEAPEPGGSPRWDASEPDPGGMPRSEATDTEPRPTPWPGAERTLELSGEDEPPSPGQRGSTA
ncbi:hypothetical protein, partial [Micromonospora qiuiae]|uniref:hypothetical protein n=1 Tax=Micromonospora qiuiae TaxID=502268 RepID=UPI00195174BE